MKAKIIFLWWVPWSWKSTWIKENINNNYIIIEFDDFIREEKKISNIKGCELSEKALEKSWNKAFNLLKEGNNIIFDAPNLRKNQRKKFFNQLKKEWIIFSWIWKDISFCKWLERNKNREFKISIENQIIFHCIQEPFEKNEWFFELQNIKDKEDKILENEIKKYLKNKKNYKNILNFPEISETNEVLKFFDISLSWILENEKNTPKENLLEFYNIITYFYFEKIQLNSFYISSDCDKSKSIFKKNFFNKIVNCRCWKIFY